MDLGATATSGVRCRSLDMWHLRIGTGCSSSECRVCLTIGHRQTPMLYLLFYAKKTPKSAILVHFGWYILVYWYTPFQDTHFLKLPIWVCRYSPNSRLSALRFLDRPILAKGEDDPVGYRMTETILLSRVTWRSEMPESKGGKHVERRWNKGVSISILDCYFVVHTKQCEPTPQWRYILTHQVFGSALLDGRWDPQPFLPRAKDDFPRKVQSYSTANRVVVYHMTAFWSHLEPLALLGASRCGCECTIPATSTSGAVFAGALVWIYAQT